MLKEAGFMLPFGMHATGTTNVRAWDRLLPMSCQLLRIALCLAAGWGAMSWYVHVYVHARAGVVGEFVQTRPG